MWEASARIRQLYGSACHRVNDTQGGQKKWASPEDPGHRGGFPVPYDGQVVEFEKLANLIDIRMQQAVPEDIEIIAEPGRSSRLRLPR